MIRDQFILDLNRELIVDNFAGGGGASAGIELAVRRHVDLAINHNLQALGMHERNHPQTRHLPEDVFAVDPVKETQCRPVGLAWFSPDCKHFSKAKGGKPVDKRIRGLAWVALHWVNKVAPRVIVLENVEEFQTWCPVLDSGKASPWRKGWFFRCFIGALQRRGYAVEWRELRACDYGTPTIRKRLFLVARRDGVPIAWPAPTHAEPTKAKTLKLKPWRTAAECIDWSLPCPSIFLGKAEARAAKCKRPLVKATLRRLARGIGRYVMEAKQPFIVSLTHQGAGEWPCQSVGEPIKTLTGAHRGEKALAMPTLAPFVTEHANATTQRNFAANEPLRTQCAQVKGGHFGLVAASIAKMRGNSDSHAPGHEIREPLHTISAGGNHHGIVAAYLAQHNGGENGHQTTGHDARQPMSTIASKGSNQAVVGATIAAYYGSEEAGQPLNEPLRTTTAKPRFGLGTWSGVPLMSLEMAEDARRVAAFLREHGVEFEGEFATLTIDGVVFVIVDVGMRMLTPRELFRAQGFPDSYVIDRAVIANAKTGQRHEVVLTKEAQVRMCGNSVCPPLARALVEANVPEMILEEAA